MGGVAPGILYVGVIVLTLEEQKLTFDFDNFC